MRIGTSLYVKNSAEAVRIYEEAFGLTLGYNVKNPDGSYFHSELYKDGQEILSVIEAKNDKIEHTTQISVIFDSEAEVEKAFALLSNDGIVMTPIGPLPWSPCGAEITDKFGVWWYLSAPQHYPPDDYDPQAPWDASMYKRL